jgi:hypothetical protein
VPSIRWENLRDGMEDYEYLYLISGLPQIGLANTADGFVARVVASRTLFSLVPTDLEAARAAMAAQIMTPKDQVIHLPMVKR